MFFFVGVFILSVCVCVCVSKVGGTKSFDLEVVDFLGLESNDPNGSQAMEPQHF